MRPRSSLNLVLSGTLPLALGACNQADTPEPPIASPVVNLLVKSTFATLRECAESSIPMKVCSLAHTNALSEHSQNTRPSSNKTVNNPSVLPGDCRHPNRQVKGFELTISGSLSRTEYYKIREPLLQINAVRTEDAVSKEKELVLASLLSQGQSTKYFSHPIYGACNNRSTSSSPTLLRSFTSGSFINYSSSPTITRGGFGDQAKARSGWSSSSSSRFSFGG